MNGKERIEALLEGRQPDHIPSGFWLHFSDDNGYGEKAVKNHLEFHRQTQSDICKIMNENFLSQGFFINCCNDWNKVKAFDKNAPFIQNEIELVKRVADKIDGQAFIAVTIFDISVNLSHVVRKGNIIRRDRFIPSDHLRENPKGVESAMEAVAEIESYLIEECLKAGADGIYFAEHDRKTFGYTAEEFEKYLKPNNKTIINSAKSGKNILHICGKNVDLNEFADYESKIVNWSAGGNNLSLTEGRKLFPGRILLGGLNNEEGPIYDASPSKLENEVRRVIQTVGKDDFILGAGCTLHENTDYAMIRTAVNAAANYR